MTRNYNNGNFEEVSVLFDSLNGDPQISLSTSSIAWVNNGVLLFNELYQNQDTIYKLDSNSCSKPNIRSNILYEKTDSSGQNIYTARWDRYPARHWEIIKISDGAINLNPKTGFEGGGIVFEFFNEGCWKIIYGSESRQDTTNNHFCNYKNPVYFTYPVTTSSSVTHTPFFIAFDSDSIANNKEIMIRTMYYGTYDSLINISNLEGDDTFPYLALISNGDTVFVSIVWENRFNNKTNIWAAKTVFNPIIGSVDDENKSGDSFVLYQNYPNPFNPSTTISYYIPKVSYVELKVYDILGREVTMLVDGYKQAGNYSCQLSTDNLQLSSGVYFYLLRVGNSSLLSGYREVKKMLLLK